MAIFNRRSVNHSTFPIIISFLIFFITLINGDVNSPDIHDILPVYNIPKGILPNAVKSYTFSSKDGSFTVEMDHTCYVKFADDQLVYYDKVIKGKLTYGKISQVSGIQAKKLFIWVSVTGLDVHSDQVEFHVGAISQQFPIEQFQEIPTCIKNRDFNPYFKSFLANY